MPTSVTIGYGSRLAYFSGAAFVDIAEITNLKAPGYSRDAIDATHMASPNNFREFIAGLMDAGEVSLDVNFIPSASDVFVSIMVAGVGQFRLTHPNGVRMSFDAIMTGYEPSEPLDDKMTASVTIKVSGKPVLS
jgi:Lambda phage tail tube protein, TTP